MLNFTSQVPENDTEPYSTFAIVFIIIDMIVLLFHAILQWVIYKLRVNDENQYHLIRILSSVDSIQCILIVLKNLYAVGLSSIGNQTVIKWLTTLVYIFNTSSMIVTILIVVDRFIAVKYPLRYNELVCKRRINITVSISVLFCAVVFCCLSLIDNVIRITTRNVFFANRGTLIFLVVLRTATCITIVVMGKITIHVRDASETNIPHARNPHGVEAERLDVIIKLKRSIKDVFKLNIWTCVFLAPMIFFTLVLLFSEMSEEIFKLNFIFALINIISNPIVYLTCFTKIRQYWRRRWFQRGPIDSDVSA